MYQHYTPFWQRGIAMDIVDELRMTEPGALDGYKLVVAPMMYMVKPGVAEALSAFVEAGGTFVATYYTGLVNETDLCFLTGFPGPLRELLGVWVEEHDSLAPHHEQHVLAEPDNPLGLTGQYDVRQIAESVHCEGATLMARFTKQFYAMGPAVTMNAVGKGQAWYVASRNDERFMNDFTLGLIRQLKLLPTLGEPGEPIEMPRGVTAQRRGAGDREYVFLLNFNDTKQAVSLGDATYTNVLSGAPETGEIKLGIYGVEILKRDLV